MSIDGASEESLNMESSSIFLHLMVDTLGLIFVAHIPSPCFLDSDSCTGSTDDLINIENEGLVIFFKNRHDIRFLFAGLELQCSCIVIIYHP